MQRHAFREDLGTPLTSKFFFNHLPAAPTFAVALEGDYDHELPDDWWIVVTDIENSTQAIEEGRYKDVNTLGGAVIMAAINLDRSIDIPFIFGGDGATLAIPPDLEMPMRRALLATKNLADQAFDLSLRVAMIPVRDLIAQQKKVRIVKYQHSQHLHSAMLVGEGWILAETWTKAADVGDLYRVYDVSDLSPHASYEGFECRWQSVPSRRDHKLCLIVASANEGEKFDREVFRRVLALIRGHFGDLSAFHPLTTTDLRLSFNPFRLKNESKIRVSGWQGWSNFKYILKIMCLNLIGEIFFRFKVKTSQVDWAEYKPDFVKNADFCKFDGTLKMVLDSTVEKTASLEAALEKLYQERKIVYGIHRSKSALLTCLVFSYAGHHAHFVDGDGGGYAMAAFELKKRRRQLASRAR